MTVVGAKSMSLSAWLWPALLEAVQDIAVLVDLFVISLSTSYYTGPESGRASGSPTGGRSLKPPEL